jgi:hypothetical protein
VKSPSQTENKDSSLGKGRGRVHIEIINILIPIKGFFDSKRGSKSCFLFSNGFNIHPNNTGSRRYTSKQNKMTVMEFSQYVVRKVADKMKQ